MAGRRTTNAPADIADAADAPGDPEEEAERGPLRRCIVTRERQAKELMLRFVLSPERAVVPDLGERLPGRGMWLSAKADVIERAVTRGAFAKASRGVAHVPPDLRARIEDGLRGRVRDLVGFARRAGQAVSGWQAAREWLQAGRVGLVVQAADGSPAERARLVGLRQVPVVAPMGAAELGALFGRDRAVHVAVAPGRLAERIAAEAARLAGVAAAGLETGGAPPRAAHGDPAAGGTPAG
ncbi:RNA-binding protein [Falsiroseomonas sp. CW058]|uniref:RNA-binding protein n=1 Tax=Falsiroseomonas sp. CW058 TaxID=3388664 RepID=UPI003D31A693